MAVAKTPNTLPPPSFEKPVKLLVITAPHHTAPYHKDITDDLLAGATAALTEAGVEFDKIEVPGVLEIPTAIAIAERMSNFDGYVGLGCILRGKTSMHKTISKVTYRALSQLGLNGICVGNGILTVRAVRNSKQAKVQASRKDHDFGADAAIAALHLVALSRKWGRETKGMGFRPASGEFLMAASSENGPKTT